MAPGFFRTGGSYILAFSSVSNNQFHKKAVPSSLRSNDAALCKKAVATFTNTFAWVKGIGTTEMSTFGVYPEAKA